MEELNVKPVQQIMDAITSILRYVASGFVALVVYIFLYDKPLNTFAEGSWFFLLATASLGILTYAFHISFLDKIFYRRIAYKVFIASTGNTEEKLKAALADFGIVFQNKEEIKSADLTFALVSQTYLRNISENQQVKVLQHEMEKRLSLLCFLYCSFYQVTIIILYFLCTYFYFNMGNICWPYVLSKIIPLLIIDVSLLVFALKFNKRICLRDAWAVTNFYQKVPTTNTTKASPAVVQGGGSGTPTIKDLLQDIKLQIAEIEKASDTINKDLG